MVKTFKVLAAVGVVFALAAPALAQKQRLFGGQTVGEPRMVTTARGNRVEVVRAQVPDPPPEPDEIDEPGLEPIPEGNFESDFGRDDSWPAEGGDTEGGDSVPYCEECSRCDCCCTPFWTHRSYIFGEFLYLQPMGADIAYAIQQNGVGGAGTVPAGRVGVVDQPFTPAYRVGFGKALNDCASIGASYANYHSHGDDVLFAPEGLGGTVASLVLHPNSTNAGSTSSVIEADEDIDFQLVDLEYRRIWHVGPMGAVNYVVGVRYGKLQQDFQQFGNFAPPVGAILTTTSIDFESAGLRTGLDVERQFGASRFSAYGKGFISLLFGKFNTNYTQLDTTTTIVQAQSNWRDGRVVPVLEYEVGVNWTSFGGHWRFSTGYYTAFWFNSITTGQYIQAVQNADFVGLSETISFDGLVARAEFRF
jgi:Legionella pneumophila major outer membrane protein precursor